MAECDAVPGGERPRLEQRIFHARNLLQHGFERLPYHRGTHLAGAQVAHFLDLQELKERVTFGGSHQSGLLPGCQLARRDSQDSQQIGLTVSVHDCYEALSVLSEKLLLVGKAKLA